MKIEVELSKNYGRLLNREPFFMVENENLEIEFCGIDNSMLVLTISNGDMHRQMLVRKKQFEVPKDFIFEGELRIIVNRYSGTKVVSKWLCEPILIVAPKEDYFEGFSAIEEFRNEVQNLKDKLLDLQENLCDLQQQVRRLWEIEEA